MSDEVHEFGDSLKIGERYEKELDAFFSKYYVIKPVNIDNQRLGIDRVFTRKDGTRFTVEYKADDRAAETGNAFVETVSVSTTNKPGWAYTSCSQILVYYLTTEHKTMIFEMLDIKNNIDGWKEKYKEAPAKNNGYVTMGVCVPLGEFEKLAINTQTISCF